tara:strand:- start:1084 stop:1929 length:846 start_codon:yes stop_codon:yes gene_type:complete
MMNFRNTINKAVTILENNSIKNANFDAELLFSTSLNVSREKILLNLEKTIGYREVKKYFNLINRRIKKEPLSQIVGKKSFWKNEFEVNRHVLTPRNETEFLVEEILKIYKKNTFLSILDVGVGSGCIIISLLKEKQKWVGTGIDISKLAIKIAKYNAKIQQVENRIRFIKSDIDKFSSSKYDLVVSNPPYINKIGYNNLDLGVRDYEPKQALYGGLDGLRVIEKVVKKSRYVLKNNGLLVMEIGSGQHNDVSSILKFNGFYIKNIIKDYQKIKRCIISKKI